MQVKQVLVTASYYFSSLLPLEMRAVQISHRQSIVAAARQSLEAKLVHYLESFVKTTLVRQGLERHQESSPLLFTHSRASPHHRLGASSILTLTHD